MKPNIDLLCPWCSVEFPNNVSYNKHYRSCLLNGSEITEEEAFDRIHNENNY